MATPYETQLADAALQQRRAQYLGAVQREAERAGIPWQLLDATIIRESGYQAGAEGDRTLPGGSAVGFGQLRPAAAIDAGIDPNMRHDPETNIRGTANYLAQMYRRADGDWGRAGAGYNYGPSFFRVADHQGRGTDDYRGWMEAAQAYSEGAGAPQSPTFTQTLASTFAPLAALVPEQVRGVVPVAADVYRQLTAPAEPTAPAAFSAGVRPGPPAQPMPEVAPFDVAAGTLAPRPTSMGGMSLAEVLRYANYRPSYRLSTGRRSD